MLTLKEIQECELKILTKFDEYCKYNGILYSLGGGTLLGAIRHKGFIPWDDDIDVFMTREEYDNLINCLRLDNLHIDCQYKAFLPFENDYYYPFIKIVDLRTEVVEGIKRPIKDMGIWIDIFPVDFCAEDYDTAIEFAKRQKYLTIKYYKMILKYPYNSIENVLKNIYLFFYRVLFKKYKEELQKRCDALSMNKPTKYCGTLAWTMTEKDLYPSEWFKDYTTTIFEHKEFQIFSRWNEILTHRYGDYMVLPKEEDRHSHLLTAYYK